MVKQISLLVVVFFISWNLYGYESTQKLTLPVDQIELFRIDAGPGELEIQGVDNLQKIEVTATVVITRSSTKERDQILNEDIVLDLRKTDAKTAVLVSQYNRSFSGLFGSRPNVRIDLEVNVPKRITMEVDDSSGDLAIENMLAWIRIDDSSGEMNLSNLSGDLFITDSSGDIDITKVVGNLEVEDSSGDFYLTNVKGGLTLDDSSGEIEISDLSGDVYISDSSGDMELQNITGNVRIRDDSGSIDLRNIGGDVEIEEDGSGSVHVENVKGTFTNRAN